MNEPTYAVAKEASLLVVADPSGNHVIRIEKDGRLFWRGREVHTDDDFRAAMKDLGNNLAILVGLRWPK